MNTKRIIILTGNNKFFGQTRRPWVTMNVERIKEILEQNGFTVEIYSFPEIVNQKIKLRDSIIFYTFSQKRNIREYIQDVVYHLDDGSNFLIPSFELLKCHENKGFQELYKEKIGFFSLKALYFTEIKDIAPNTIKYPVVIKAVTGSNAKRVFLAHNEDDLSRIVKKFESIPFKDKIDLFRRKYLRPKKKFKEYPEFTNRGDYLDYREYVKRQKNFILQEFIPDLEHDFRVLVLFDKYYVTMRRNRDDDFRASGAKKFNFNFEVDPRLLDYAKQLYEKFDTPFLSIDLGFYKDNIYLFEFQALHYGVNVLIKSSGYYAHQDNQWKFIQSESQIEKEHAEALVRYIRSRFPK